MAGDLYDVPYGLSAIAHDIVINDNGEERYRC